MKGRSATPISYGPEARGRPGSAVGYSNNFVNGHPHGVQTQQRVVGGRMQQLQAENSVTIGSSCNGVLCEVCLRCLQDLRRQAFQLVLPSPKNMDFLLREQPNLAASVVEKLQQPVHEHCGMDDCCTHCATSMTQLKQEAVTLVQNMEFSTAAAIALATNGSITGGLDETTLCGGNPKVFTAASGGASRSSPHLRNVARYGRALGPHLLMQQEQQEQVKGYYSQQVTLAGQYVPRGAARAAAPRQLNQMLQVSAASDGKGTSSCSNDLGVLGAYGCAQTTSAAMNFFTRAGQKMHATSASSIAKKKRRGTSNREAADSPVFNTCFRDVLRLNEPPAPALLLKPIGRKDQTTMGKVKVMLRVVHSDTGKGTDSSSCVSVDKRRKQVTLFDPGSLGGFAAPSQRRSGISAPKLFAFDAVFNEEDALSELCSSALSDIVQAVVNGVDGCVFSFGQSHLGKSYTMIGSDSSCATLGAIPCAISWLFRLINEQKERTGARFSVRVSAVEVCGKEEKLKDLLADIAAVSEAACQTAPGVYLRDDPISGTQLENQSELRAPTADKAAYYLDAALSQRSSVESDDERRNSHLLFTLHVYQYRVEKSGGGTGVAGGRSRLHLIDLGSGRAGGSALKDGSNATSQSLSLPALGSVVMALVNGQRHIPHRDSKLSQLLREALGSLACRACMIAHVSSNIQHYNDSLQVVQLASKIQRLRRRKVAKFSGSATGTSSDDSSSCDSFGVRRAGRLRPQMGTLREGVLRSSALTSSDNDYTSSSEQSCDTVIYLGGGGSVTDGEHPPGRHSTLMRKLAAASSGEESGSDTRKSLTGMSPMQKRKLPRTNAKAWPKVSMRDAIETLSTQKEQWVDGPRACYPQTVAAATTAVGTVGFVVESPLLATSPTENKAAVVTPDGSSEKWIDGPNASPPSTEERRRSLEIAAQSLAAAVPPNVNKVELRLSGMIDAATQSEEPYESESSTSTYSTLDKKGNVLSDISEHTEDTSTTGGDASGGKESASITAEDEEDCAAHAVLESIEIPEVPQDQAQQPTPLTTSRPAPLAPTLTNKTLNSDCGTSIVSDPLIARVKPFVRDWVEKHSALSSVESNLCSDELQCSSPQRKIAVIKDAKQQQLTGSASCSPVRMQPCTAESTCTTFEKPQSVSGSTHSSTPRHDAGVCKKRLRSKGMASQHPQPGHVPTNFSRVAEWVQSVATETSQNISASCDVSVSANMSPGALIRSSSPLSSVKLLVANNSLDRKNAPSPQPPPRRHSRKTSTTASGGSQLTPSALSESEQEMERVWFSTCGEQQQLAVDAAGYRLYGSRLCSASDSPCSGLLSSPVAAPLPGNYYSTPHCAPPLCQTSFGVAPQSMELPADLPRANCMIQRSNVCVIGASPRHKAIASSTASLSSITMPLPAPPLPQAQHEYTSYSSESKQHQAAASSSKHVAAFFLSKCSKGEAATKNANTSNQRKSSAPSLSSSVTSGSKASMSSSLVLVSSPKTPIKMAKDKVKVKENKKRSSSASPVSSSHSNHGANASESVASSARQDFLKTVSLLPLSMKESKKERSKESKHRDGKREKESRLSFLTSPLFGKRKEKNSSSQSTSSKDSQRHHHHHHAHGHQRGIGSRLMELSGRSAHGRSSSHSQSHEGCAAASSHSSEHTFRHHYSTSISSNYRILSPYHTVTQPRISVHSSSGHGSDCSSLYGIKSRSGCKIRHGGTSSGYESMLRDSEASSSHNDSTSESSVSGVIRAARFHLKRKSRSSSSSSRSRSRSAPPHSNETTKSTQSLPSARICLSRTRQDTHSSSGQALGNDELRRLRIEEAEEIARQIHYERIHELLARQDDLKHELMEAKERLMVDRSSWSFDLHVAEQMDPDQPCFLEALQKETEILAKRVEACKSHIMMVSCFDVKQCSRKPQIPIVT